MAGLRLTQSAATFEKLALNALVVDLNSYFKKSLVNITDPVRQEVRQALLSSNTILDLSGPSKLRAALGIPKGQNVVTPVIEAVANSVVIVPRPIKLTGKNFTGGFSINVQSDDFANLLGADFGRVDTEKGAQLPWLGWLLTRGSSVIVANFGVKYRSGTGRSGGGQMAKGYAPFMIDPVHSGTLADNFVTRALEKNADDIIKAIMRAF